MKIKTTELAGPALDWAVAQCEDIEVWGGEYGLMFNALLVTGHISRGQSSHQAYEPTTNWSQGGPISERENIWVKYITCDDAAKNHWEALSGWFPQNVVCTGPTELVAKMRCYVASKLGDEVEIPEELT